MSARMAQLPGIQAKLAFARRKFHAWWEGYAFDGEVERTAIKMQFPNRSAVEGRPASDIVAETIWGEGRLEPGSAAWTMHFAEMLALPPRANVVVFGAGAGAPLDDLKKGARWKVSGLTSAKNVDGGDLRTYDMAMQRRVKAGVAGALSFFELNRDANPSAFAKFAAQILLPEAKAVFVDYAVARKGARLRSCFPDTKHGAPKTEAEYRDILGSAGYDVEEICNETAKFQQLVSDGWARWRRAYEAISTIEDTALRADMMRAMAAHASVWAERFEAMRSGQLRVSSYCVVRK